MFLFFLISIIHFKNKQTNKQTNKQIKKNGLEKMLLFGLCSSFRGIAFAPLQTRGGGGGGGEKEGKQIQVLRFETENIQRAVGLSLISEARRENTIIQSGGSYFY